MTNLALVKDTQEGGKEYKWVTLLAKARKALETGELVTVSPDKIRRMEGQPRTYFNQNSISLLADSMESVGQWQPGTIRRVKAGAPIEFELLDGERRWRAALHKKLPYRALLVDVEDEAVPYIVAAVANFNRENHTPIEISDAIERLSQMRIPLKEIASVLGLSENWAGRIHGLQRLHPKVREMLDPTLPKEKTLPVLAAIEISRHEQRFQLQLANRILSRKVSLKILRAEAAKVSKAGGGYIRAQRSEPVRVWQSVQSLSRQALRVLTDLEFTLKGNGSFTAIDQRSKSEIRRVLDSLEEAAKKGDKCQQLIKKHRSED
ncbi:MAG: hypothetical protein A2741_01700 [Candidatus Zambryskibacteria bacterium RIFCSPHIGHO2_01_FULL_43_27]|uniref:ParB-like N-terminal domain-containing protein n=1 Tax=Candidatus Zambryskibacteria bacterium RIFCSPLOWO2_01_FULL_43_17 TaxID=1802760 RepID=A0A1G2U0D6_9BACT|nr:MAG: hypothetical protein A2741_01700 [Candidatus Zambryskibacteria bacterium RIFCSPHIGHO2_01_FULL_43_27]OHB00697.1 MAG: hypothetical protein A3E93_03040 [Candidatus Zambryskibacteria bacterium RIFCSPHIGHO2_12_FULL_43_12b]OHB02996.1 MAG: hypothetical protein A2920_02905 [Candidatus Zambryskibacteria bacterium RIFCSPLOWO2_01_FULL_43_17]